MRTLTHNQVAIRVLLNALLDDDRSTFSVQTQHGGLDVSTDCARALVESYFAMCRDEEIDEPLCCALLDNLLAAIVTDSATDYVRAFITDVQEKSTGRTDYVGSFIASGHRDHVILTLPVAIFC